MARFGKKDEGAAVSPLPNPVTEEMRQVAQLTGGEQMFLSLLRHRLVGMAKRNPKYWSGVLRQITRHGDRERKLVLLTALEELLQAIARWPQRMLYIHPPCCSMVTPDEMLLLGLIGAVQAGDQVAAKAIAERLVSEGSETMVVAAAAELGDMALAAGIIFKGRSDRRRVEMREADTLERVGRTLH